MTTHEAREANRFELLRPRQIEQIRATCPVAMFPFGTLEFHGRHLPVGLDALKAYELLLRLGGRIGGVVLPPLYAGVGGGHGQYDWTILTARECVEPLMRAAFRRMYEGGFHVQVALTGHTAPEQAEALAAAAEAARRDCPKLQVWAGRESDALGPDWPAPGADHAGKWETSLLQALRPDLVRVGELNLDGRGLPAPFPEYATEAEGQRRIEGDSPADALYGIRGADPRVYASQNLGLQLAEAIVARLEAWVRQALESLGKVFPHV